MNIRPAHVHPTEDDGWTTYAWVRSRIGRLLTVDLLSSHNLLTEPSETPVVVIGDATQDVEIRDRRELDALIRALADARRVWDALNP